MLKIREVHCKRWFLSDWIAGITLYPFIFYNTQHRAYKDEDTFVAMRFHEFVHVKQVQDLGWFRFYTSYLYQSLRFGYENNKYEVEAYRKEREFIFNGFVEPNKQY